MRKKYDSFDINKIITLEPGESPFVKIVEEHNRRKKINPSNLKRGKDGRFLPRWSDIRHNWIKQI